MAFRLTTVSDMPIKVDDKRTSSYIGTFHYESADDMLQLSELRKMVMNLNRMLKEDGYNYRFRLSVQGRMGKNNPNAQKYKNPNRRFGGHRYQRIQLADASRVDAYIHRRYER